MTTSDWMLSRRVKFESHGDRTGADASVLCSNPPRSVAEGAPLDETNRGFALAMKNGWSTNSRAGKHEDGIAEPLGIDAQARHGNDRTCLGGRLLDAEQARALELALAGESFFMTGGAGSGKSFTVRAIIQALRAKYAEENPDGNDAVFVCASTGIAAVPHDGTTLHAFASVGKGDRALPDLIASVRRSKRAKKRWRQCRCLLIDEVSMIDADFLDKLEGIARAVRGSEEPFGGLQLILVGDFFQLAPPEGRFAFQAACWQRVVRHTVLLATIYRQRDGDFVSLLNELRRGSVSAATAQRLRHAVESPPTLTDEHGGPLMEVMKLFPTNHQADMENSSRLAELPGAERRYAADDYVMPDAEGGDGERAKKWLEKLPVEASLVLKVGAPVTLLKNLDPPRLVNGSRGRVIGFEAASEPPEDQPMAATAADAAAVSGRLYPLVQFNSGVRRLVTAADWTLEESGVVLARRTQVPLKCAWALSIHKAQGVTLGAAELDLAGCWASGQAYTALSRMTTLERTRLLSFDPKKVIAHEDVRAFYQGLEMEATRPSSTQDEPLLDAELRPSQLEQLEKLTEQLGLSGTHAAILRAAAEMLELSTVSLSLAEQLTLCYDAVFAPPSG